MYKSEQLLPSTVDHGEFQKKKYSAASGCCCFCVVLFLLLFFLIPRRPYAKFVSSTVYFSPYHVVQTYNVYNRNMYSLTLSDFDMTVTAYTSSGNFQSANGTLQGDSNSFTVPKNSNKEMNLIYYWNTSTSQQQAIRQQCKTTTGVTYTTRGTMNMKTSVTNFHNVQLGPWSTIYFC
jgi:LEA14-like dessication related protein